MAIPTRIINTVNEEDKARLLYLFKNFFAGKEKAGKKRDFLKALYGESAASNESYNNSQDRAFRLMVETLIDEGEPICSSSGDGYWYGTSLQDGMPSVVEGYSRSTAIRERSDRLEKNLLERYGGQMELL